MALRARAAALRASTTNDPDEAMLSAAMASTESEIFNAAMGDDDLELDGDHSLEEMGDELGDVIDDDEADADEEEGDRDGALETRQEGDEDEDGDEFADDGQDGRTDRRQDDRRDQRRPLRADDDYTRQREDSIRREAALEAQLETANARLSALESRGTQPARTEAETAGPDPLLDPQGFRAAIRDELRGEFRQTMEQRLLANSIDATHAAYRNEDRGEEFEHALGEFNALATRAKNNQQAAAVVRRIVNSADPGYALMEWAEEALDLDSFREEIAGNRINQAARLLGVSPDDLAALTPQRARNRDDRRGERQERQRNDRQDDRRGGERQRAGRDDRSERGRRLPSLNGAGGGSGRSNGGGNRQSLDQRGFDGSESAIFDFAMSP